MSCSWIYHSITKRRVLLPQTDVDDYADLPQMLKLKFSKNCFLTIGIIIIQWRHSFQCSSSFQYLNMAFNIDKQQHLLIYQINIYPKEVISSLHKFSKSETHYLQLVTCRFTPHISSNYIFISPLKSFVHLKRTLQ